MANVFFTSDLHFGHENLVTFRNSVHKQGFTCSDDVDEWLIERWNSRIRKRDDIVWVLGDAAWGYDNFHHFARLNGTKKLIMGNHDLEKGNYNIGFKRMMAEFDEVYGVKKKYGFVMSHCPIHPNELEYRNWHTNVHGHIHHIEKCLGEPKYINVNVDVNNGFPLTLDEIREKIK